MKEDNNVSEELIRNFVMDVTTYGRSFNSRSNFDYAKDISYEEACSLAFALLHFSTNLVWSVSRSQPLIFNIDSELLGNTCLALFNVIHETFENDPSIEFKCWCHNKDKQESDYMEVFFKGE